MNLCDYYVHEVLSPPIFREQDDYAWWELTVSYYYDNGELKKCKLTFNNKEEAEQVCTSYHFTR